MLDYRLYYHDSALVLRSEEFKAWSDAQAVQIVRAMNKCVKCQLWSGDRFVAMVAMGSGERRNP